MSSSLKFYTYLFTLLLFNFQFDFSASAQTIDKDHQLLWEISGNGLEKPSYLYGTMHLADKRVFEFSDSVLLKLEAADAFAMEALPEDIMSYMFENILVFDSENEQKWKDLIGEERYSRIDKWLQSKANLSLSDVNTDYPWMLTSFAESATPNENEDTFLDAHLYQIAKLQSKKLLGLEEMKDYNELYEGESVDEQIGLLERVINSKNSDKKMEQQTEKLVDIYRRGNLAEIDAYIQKYGEEEAFFMKKMLDDRNGNMANRIEEYAKEQSTFVALGAAHIAGKNSVIDLLKEKGYTLRSVPAVFTGLAEKYEVPKSAVEAKWMTFEIPNVYAHIELPAQPYEMKFSEMPNFFKSYGYPDMGEGMNYVVVVMDFPSSIPRKVVGQSFVDYSKGLASEEGVEVLGHENISDENRKGMEVITLEDNTTYTRYQLFLRGNTIYVNALSGNNESIIKNEKAEHYFNSFRLHEIEAAPWVTITSKAGAFQIDMPTEEEESTVPFKGEDGELQVEAFIYKSQEITEGGEIGYFARYQNYAPGFVVEDAEEVYKSNFANFFEQLKTKGEIQDTIINDIPSKFVEVNRENASFYIQMFLKGNRLYMLISASEGNVNKEKINRFYNSFEFLEPEVSEMQTYKSSVAPVSFMVFDKPEIEKIANTLDVKMETLIDSMFIYNTLDENTGANYSLTVYKFIPYAYLNHPDTIFNNLIDVSGADSLISYKKLEDLGDLNLETVTYSNKTQAFTKTRTILKDGIMYEFTSLLPEEQLDSEVNNRFFGEIQIGDLPAPMDVFSEKSELIFKDLFSEQEEVKELATAATLNYDFSEIPFERLEKAFTETYPNQKENQFEIKENLLLSMYGRDSLAVFDYIQLNYDKWNNMSGVQVTALWILLDMKQQEAIDHAKKLLLNEAPAIDTSDYYIESILADLVIEDDSLQLAESLFPDILQLLDKEHYEMSVLKLIRSLVLNERFKTEYFGSFVPTMVKHFDNSIEKTKALEEETDEYYEAIRKIRYYAFILEQLEDKKEAIPMWKKMLAFDVDYLQLEIAESLWKAGQEVDAKIVEGIAATPTLRRNLYDTLKKMDKLSLFPKAYKNQASMAESLLYDFSARRYEFYPDSIVVLKARSYDYKGTKYRIFPYKMGYKNDEGELAWYLGMAGLYPWSKKELEETTFDFTDIAGAEEVTDENFEEFYEGLLKAGVEYEKRKLEREKEAASE